MTTDLNKMASNVGIENAFPSPSKNTKLLQQHAFFVLFSLGLVIFALQPIRKLVAYSSNWDNEHSSHILLIPFITAALLYLNRRSVFCEVRPSAISGGCVM